MKTQLKPQHYTHNSFLLAERFGLLSSTWFFLGYERDIPKHNDFFVSKVFGKEIIVQNFEGVIAAFQNVCAHRGSILKCTKKGNGGLRCPYHGWTYDRHGSAIGIPHKGSFKELSTESKTPKLNQFKVENISGLLFGSVPTTTLSLKDYLGSLYPIIESIGAGLGSEIDLNTMTISANWKAVVENTLESYHVDFAHPEFKKFVNSSREKIHFVGPHSYSDFEISHEAIEKWKRLSSLFESRPTKFPGYHHFFIFPNLTLATTFGNSFAIQKIVDQSCNSTFFESRVFLSKLDSFSNRAHQLMVDALKESIVKFNRNVFDEDKPLCENIQLGLEQNPTGFVFSEIEERISAFHANLSQVVAYENSAGAKEWQL